MSESSSHSAGKSHAEMRRIVVCFLFDGSEKYTKMTLNAVNSFISTTPTVAVGLLFPPHFDPAGILQQVIDPSRVTIRRYEQHFHNWNPTQYKLDIRKFAPQFSTIFWLDSDALVYKDLTDLLFEFHSSDCKAAFLKDHVCFNPQFLANWAGGKDPFVPQACFMGFKSDIIDDFFGIWENLWRTWIEPAPFANFPNPVPSFPGSAFCTEQYALGMAIEAGTVITRSQVFEIRRMTFGLRGGISHGTAAGALSSASSGISYSGSFSEESLAEQLRSLSIGGSWSGSFDTSFSGWGSAPIFSANLSWGSFSGFSFSFTSGFFESSGPSFLTSSGEYLTSGAVSSGSGIFALSSATSSYSGSAQLFGVVPVDHIGGGIVHFYSAFYDQSSAWFQSNQTEVVPELENYWKSGSANFQ